MHGIIGRIVCVYVCVCVCVGGGGGGGWISSMSGLFTFGEIPDLAFTNME